MITANRTRLTPSSFSRRLNRKITERVLDKTIRNIVSSEQSNKILHKDLNLDQQLISDLKSGIQNLRINKIDCMRFPEEAPYLKFYITLCERNGSQQNKTFFMPIKGDLETGTYKVTGTIRSGGEEMLITELSSKYKTQLNKEFKLRIKEEVQRWSGIKRIDLNNIRFSLIYSLNKFIA